MDFQGRRLSNGDLAVGIGAIVAIIATFLPWYSVSSSCNGIPGCGGSYGSSGFESWGILFFLGSLVVLVFFLLRTFLSTQVAIPALPMVDWMIYLIAAIVAAIGALLYWLLVVNSGASGNYSGYGYSVSAGLGFGWFVAIVAAAVMIIGAVLKKADPQPAVAPRATAAAPMGYTAPPAAAPMAPPAGMPQQAAPAPPMAPPAGMPQQAAPAPPAAPPMQQPPVAPPPPPAPPVDPNQPPA